MTVTEKKLLPKLIVSFHRLLSHPAVLASCSILCLILLPLGNHAPHTTQRALYITRIARNEVNVHMVNGLAGGDAGLISFLSNKS